MDLQHDSFSNEDASPSINGGAGQSSEDTPPRRAVSMMEARGSIDDDGCSSVDDVSGEEKGSVLAREANPM